MSRTLLNLATLVYLGLIALLLAWVVWLSPPPPERISLTLILLLGPLLLPLRGLLRGRRYTIAWSTLLVLLYFAHGVGSAAAGGVEAWLGGAEIALATAYFGLAIAYVRASRPSTADGPGSRG